MQNAKYIFTASSTSSANIVIFRADAARRGGREFKVHGPLGGIAMDVTLPDGVDPEAWTIGAMEGTGATEGTGTTGRKCPMVILIHGSKDTIVPMACSERFVETYGERSELIVVEGENHMITLRKKKTVALAVEFFRDLWN